MGRDREMGTETESEVTRPPLSTPHFLSSRLRHETDHPPLPSSPYVLPETKFKR